MDHWSYPNDRAPSSLPKWGRVSSLFSTPFFTVVKARRKATKKVCIVASLSIYQSIFLPIYWSVSFYRPNLCSVANSVYLSIDLSILLSFYLSISLWSFSLSTWQDAVHPNVLFILRPSVKSIRHFICICHSCTPLRRFRYIQIAHENDANNMLMCRSMLFRYLHHERLKLRQK